MRLKAPLGAVLGGIACVAPLATSAPADASSWPAQSKQELKDRIWFVSMAAGLKCAYRKGTIDADRYGELIVYNIKRRNKENIKPWSKGRNAFQAVDEMSLKLDSQCKMADSEAKAALQSVFNLIK